jgi:hypothetical protein
LVGHGALQAHYLPNDKDLLTTELDDSNMDRRRRYFESLGNNAAYFWYSQAFDAQTAEIAQIHPAIRTNLLSSTQIRPDIDGQFDHIGATDGIRLGDNGATSI